jgi:UPF0176 protein
MQSAMPIQVAALYRFARIDDPVAARLRLIDVCGSLGVKGTLIVAGEGINGTVAAPHAAIAQLLAEIEAMPGFGTLDVKYSQAEDIPFHRMKVRLKAEIVTMGHPAVDPSATAGTYVDPCDWNALIADPGTVVIDTRNDYEVGLGTFEGARDPQTKSFREFPAWIEARRDELAGRKVAMFCTGGIRCEKATALAREIGLDQVFHLRGGILKYLEEVPEDESLWRGECFVFDERVSVVHGLHEGEAELCRGCRMPLTPDDRRSAAYREGISCPHCADTRSEEDRARYAERHRQVQLAARRGLPKPIGGT